MPGYYNDVAMAVIYGGDGNIYAAGILCEYGYEDYVVISLTSAGSERWAYIRDISSWDTARDLVWGADGNIYVTGWSRGPGGSLDFRVVGLRPNGAEKWVYTYAQSNGDDRGSFIAYGLDHNLYVAGYTKPGGSGSDLIVISVDTLGQQRWIHTYNGPGNGDDYAIPVAAGPDGCVYVAGEATGSGSMKDMLVMSLTSSGNQNWLSLFNGPGNRDDEVYALACASTGGLYAAGYSTGTSTGKDLAVMSLTGSGDTTWSYRYNGTGNGNDAGYSLVMDSDSVLYVAAVSHGLDTTDILMVSLETGAGVQETREDELVTMNRLPTIIRRVLYLPQASSVMRGASSVMLDITGRKVMELKPGANDVRHLAPGVYFVREAQAQAQAQVVWKVVMAE